MIQRRVVVPERKKYQPHRADGRRLAQANGDFLGRQAFQGRRRRSSRPRRCELVEN